MLFFSKLGELRSYLDELERPWWVVDHAGRIHFFSNGGLQLWISGLLQHNTGEQVIDQTQEERFILVNLTHKDQGKKKTELENTHMAD